MGFELLALALMVTFLGAQHAVQQARPRWMTRAWDATWRDVQNRFGLSDDGDVGDIDHTPTWIIRLDAPSPRRRVVLDVSSWVARDLALTAHRGPDEVRTALFGHHLKTGDATFDQRMIVRALPTVHAIAALRPESRERWSHLPDLRFDLDDGLVRAIDAPVFSPWTPEVGQPLTHVVAVARATQDVLPAVVRAEVMALVDTDPMRTHARAALRVHSLAATTGCTDSPWQTDAHPFDSAYIRQRMGQLLARSDLDVDALRAAFVEGASCPSRLRAELAVDALRDRRWGVRAVRRAWHTVDVALARAVFCHAAADLDFETWPCPDASVAGPVIQAARESATVTATRWLATAARRLAPSLARLAIDAIAERSSIESILTLRQIVRDPSVDNSVRLYASRRLNGAIRGLGTAPGRVSLATSHATGDLALPSGS